MKLLSFGEIVWDICGDEKSLGGAPLNFAAHAVLQGWEAWLLSAVGNDSLGKEAFCRIREMGVNTDYMDVTSQMPSGKCTITLGKDGIPAYRLAENVAYDRIPAPDVFSKPFDVFAFGTLALRSEQNRHTLIKLLAQNRFSEIYTDLNIRPPFYSEESISLCLSNATIVKISDEELPLITNCLYKRDMEMTHAVKRIVEDYPQIRLLLITQGEFRAYCYDCKSRKSFHCPAEPVKVVSTVGAGDSFGATFLTWYLKTKDIHLSMKLAAKISAFVIAHRESIPEGTKEFIKTVVPH